MKTVMNIAGHKVAEFDLTLPKELRREKLEGLDVTVGVLEDRTDEPKVFFAFGELKSKVEFDVEFTGSTEKPLLDLSSMLGHVESEVAAARIVRLCEKHGSWGCPATYEQMVGRSEQNGFLMLIEAGWIRSGYMKGCYFATKDLIDKVRAKLPAEMRGFVYDPASGWLHPDASDPYHLHPKK
jgi:hypothetical protein